MGNDKKYLKFNTINIKLLDMEKKSLFDLCIDFHIKNRPIVLNDKYVMKSILMYKYSKNIDLISLIP